MNRREFLKGIIVTLAGLLTSRKPGEPKKEPEYYGGYEVPPEIARALEMALQPLADWRDLDSDTQVMGIIDTEWSEFMERAATVSMTELKGCYLERGR